LTIFSRPTLVATADAPATARRLNDAGSAQTIEGVP